MIFIEGVYFLSGRSIFCEIKNVWEIEQLVMAWCFKASLII